MNRAALYALLAASAFASAGPDASVAVMDTRPRGPGCPATSFRGDYQPLPRRASQAKRRRKARRAAKRGRR